MTDGDIYELGGEQYRFQPLNVKVAWAVTRRLVQFAGNADEVLSAIARMTDEDSDYIVNTGLRHTLRKDGTAGWISMMVGNEIRYQDITAAQMIMLAAKALTPAVSGFLTEMPLIMKEIEGMRATSDS